jgi:murein DD-endopeptidase MepM/ murein hydrolase activator NlpD
MRALVVAGVAGLGLLPAWPAHAAPQRNDSEEMLDDLSAEEHGLLDELDSIKSEIARLADQIDTVTESIAEAEVRLAEAEAAAVATEEVRLAAQRDLNTAIDLLTAEAIDLYLGSGEMKQHVAALVLDTHDMLEVYKAETYGGAVIDGQQAVVDEFRRARTVAAAAEAEAKRHRDAIADERAALDAERQRLEQLRAEQEATLVQQRASLAQLRNRRVALEADISAQTMSSDGLARELHARQADQPLAPPVPGSIVHPVRTNTSVGSPFGMRMHPILGYARPHRGADFGCRSGEPVVATADGVVAVATVRGGYGNTVVIDHGGKFATLYGHNSRLDVSVGDRVTQGEQIAACGSTGLSTGPHSHFETRIDGNPIDPVSLLPEH